MNWKDFPFHNVGFGYNPAEKERHFVVHIPKSKALKEVRVYLRGTYRGPDPIEDINADAAPEDAELIHTVEYDKWCAVSDRVRTEFNIRLKNLKCPCSLWKKGYNLVAYHLGAELTVLLWALEHASGNTIDVVYRNWSLLTPPERWWLYGIAMATRNIPGYGPNRGWRKAINIALADDHAVRL